jgi:hypothetical protein
MIPARDLDEFHMLPQSDRDFISGWFNWTDANLAYLRARKENAVLFFAKLLSFLDETRSLDLSRQAWDGFTEIFENDGVFSFAQATPSRLRRCSDRVSGVSTARQRCTRRKATSFYSTRLRASTTPASWSTSRWVRTETACLRHIYWYIQNRSFCPGRLCTNTGDVEKKGGRFLQV